MKTFCYIDGFNLYARLLSGTSYKWLNLEALCKSMLQPYHEVNKIKYFTARVSSTDQDPSKTDRQDAYWRALQTIPNLEIVMGKFKKVEKAGEYLKCLKRKDGSSTTLVISVGDVVVIRKQEEKESDVNVATHIVYDSCCEDVDSIVLLSNDSDLKAPLYFAKKKLNKKIVVLSPAEKVQVDLRKIAHFSKCIPRAVLSSCQFPNEVRSKQKTIRKPDTW